MTMMYPDTITNAESWARNNPIDPNDQSVHPGFFDEAWKGIGLGIQSGALGLANSSNRIGLPVNKFIASHLDNTLGTHTADAFQNQSDRLKTDLLAADHESETTMGMAGQIGKGVTSVLTEAGLSAVMGVPPVLGVGASESTRTYDQMRDKGVDNNTALVMGGISGLANAAYLKIPASLGIKQVLPDLAASVGLVDALGIAQRGLSSAMLESAGYPEMAKQYRAFDAQSIIADTILGGVFHGVARHSDYTALDGWQGFVDSIPTMPWRKTDEALLTKEARHKDTETAPGIPADPEAMAAHIKAMDEIEAAVSEGRAPNFDDTGIHDAKFVDNSAKDLQNIEAAQAFTDHINSEAGLLSEAYDSVLKNPSGYADDPLVMIKPEDIESVAVARGGWKGFGDIEVKGAGWGIAKFIWRHGEKSREAPEFQVSKDDVLAFPSVIREYYPSREANPDGSKGREWRVDLNGRTVVYADNLLSNKDGRHLVTIHIQRPDKIGHDFPVSKKIVDTSASPGKVLESRTKDTQPNILERTGQEVSADTRLSQSEESSNIPYEIQAAQKALVENPDTNIGIGDGETAKASEILAQHDAEIAEAKHLSNLVEMAAECALRA